MKLTRTQIISLVALGTVTIGTYGCVTTILSRNARQISHVVRLAGTESPPDDVPRASPSPTGIPTPIPTDVLALPPLPPVPQTRYDLQVESDPEHSGLRLQRAYVYLTLEAYGPAVQEFDVAVALDPARADAYLGRGQARFHVKEWTAALEDFDRARQLDSELADAYAWRGHVLAQRGDSGAATEELQQAVTLDATDHTKRILLANALLAGGRAAEAHDQYAFVLLLQPRAAEAYVGRAMALAELGQLEAAQTDLDIASSISPHSPIVMNGMAWYHAWYLDSYLHEAEQLCERALEKARDDLERARYLDTLGWVYYQQARYGDAEAALERAGELATVEGEVVYARIVEHLEAARAAVR